MSDIPGYDAWKLATPPEYERLEQCNECGERLDEGGRCNFCGRTADDEPGDVYDTPYEAETDR